jgi:hypothetical protein
MSNYPEMMDKELIKQFPIETLSNFNASTHETAGEINLLLLTPRIRRLQKGQKPQTRKTVQLICHTRKIMDILNFLKEIFIHNRRRFLRKTCSATR